MNHVHEEVDVKPATRPSFLALLDHLSTGQGVSADAAEAARTLSASLGHDQEDRPFLTVLLRTQGNRLEPLRDALLCLAGQSVDDFNVQLLVHTSDETSISAVEGVVERLEPSFARRVRVDVVQDGPRSVPLNVGIGHATGRYIAVFDDDDLVMGHWVESFKRGADASAGKLVRTVAAVQWFEHEAWVHERAGMRATSWPNPEYPTTFNFSDHILVNRSPFMTWAFPRELFTKFGVAFDEELLVCEDWDVIMQGASWCGVTEVPELVTIYRRWAGGGSSYDIHHREEWLSSEGRVRSRMNALPLIVPAGSADELKTLVGHVDVMARYGLLFRGNRMRQPLDALWVGAQPAVHVAGKVYRRLKKLRERVARQRTLTPGGSLRR